MLKRTLVLITFSYLIFLIDVHCTSAEVSFSAGTILLRGTLVKAGPNVHLVVNPETRAMVVLNLTIPQDVLKSSNLSLLQSGTRIEVCAVSQGLSKVRNTVITVKELRPLGPTEPLISYSKRIPTCDESMFCPSFGKRVPADILDKTVLQSDLPDDYFSCGATR